MPGELPSFLDTNFHGKWTNWAFLRDSGKASRSHTGSFIHSVLLKYQALFLNGEDTAMNKAGGKILTLIDFIRLLSGRETINKLVCKIYGKLDIDMCYGDNKVTERESRICWGSGAF